MLLNWHLLLSFLLLLWPCTSNALCPSSCTCEQTDKGKRKVSCIKGGMLDPIPTDEMDIGMEILEISAPSNNKNTLSITPIFQHFKNLEDLRITKSNVHQIAMHAFWGVPSIKMLDLSFNKINNVFDHNFRGLVNLIELNLDNNNLERIHSGVFKHLSELKVLSLQRNLLSELVPRMFLKLIKLEVLRLNENKFEELDPEVFKDIPQLRVLECRGCGLRRINTQIYHLLPYLAHLDLGNNQMQFIDYDEFQDLHRLRSLKLDGNMLPVVLEKTFMNQHQLKYLCLARNRLVKITNTAFLNLTSLIDLDISQNKLKKIEIAAFQYVSETLQRLVIGGNGLTIATLKMLLQTLHKVKHLDISNMKLLSLPENFLPKWISELNVSRNNISELSVEGLPLQLTKLDISENHLRGLNERVVLKLEQLKRVNLSGNPWTCNLCHITPILFHVNKTEIFKNLSCASPKPLKNFKLTSLRFEDITTCNNLPFDDETDTADNSKMSLLIGLICIVILGIFSIIFVVCSCMKRHSRNLMQQQKRAAECRENSLEATTAIFSKGEISFKFPLDLTERRMSVSTIDEIKKDTPNPNQNLPNGTPTGI